MILTHRDQGEITGLAGKLAVRLLEEKGDKAAALTCYIMAEDTDKAVKMWIEEAKDKVRKKPGNYVREMSVALLKSVLFKSVVGNNKPNMELERLAYEYIRASLCTGPMDLIKAFIERLPMARPEFFDLKALYDRVLGLLRQPKPQLWEVDAVPVPKPKPVQKGPPRPADSNPFSGKAGKPAGFPGTPSKVNPFPSQPDTAPPSFPKQAFPLKPEEAKDSIPAIPKTDPFKKVSGTTDTHDPHHAPPARVNPPPMPVAFKPSPVAPTQHPVQPDSGSTAKASPFGIPERASVAEMPQKQTPPRPFPAPPAQPFQSTPQAQAFAPPPTQAYSAPSVPEIPKTGPAQLMKTAPPPAVPVARTVPPVFRGVPTPGRVEPAAVAAPPVSATRWSIPQEYSGVYQVWSGVTSLAVVAGNPRLKAEAETKLEDLFRKLESGEMSEHEGERLIAMTQAFSSGDCQTAMAIQMELVKTAWDANKGWLPVVKNLIKAKQQGR